MTTSIGIIGTSIVLMTYGAVPVMHLYMRMVKVRGW
nr:MAG TPA: hypothetical protein [Caudoviricetes sp.]